MGTPAKIGTTKGIISQQSSEKKKKKKKMKVQQPGKVVFQFTKMLHLGKNYQITMKILTYLWRHEMSRR